MANKTAFTGLDRLKAMAIVNIFETGRPFGEYGALAVLNDGAGISYGISQFTHRSGSLHAVVKRYLDSGGRVGRATLAGRLEQLNSKASTAIASASQDRALKSTLQAAAATREMRDAQHHAAFELYLEPALEACEGSSFRLPLSLAVIYDSVNHGSFGSVRDRVRLDRHRLAAESFEKRWITEYVKKRHEWLRSIPRLKSTSYRTSFFLAQIIAGNWDLDLPVTVHGYSLSRKDFPPEIAGDAASAAGQPLSAETADHPQRPSATERDPAFPADTARPPKTTREGLSDAIAAYDRVESVVRTVTTRTDAAKSLWTTVAGTVWQTFWAVVSFFIGLPREIWLAVAVIAAVLTLAYLYRQYSLGRIRELGPFLLMPMAERHANSAEPKQ